MSARASVAFPTTAVVLLGLAAILGAESPLRSPRPQERGGLPLPGVVGETDDQRVEARLGDDPLEAAYRTARRFQHVDVMRRTAARVSDLVRGPNNVSPIVLGVLVSSGPEEEDRETRLQIRHAVHTALDSRSV